MKFVARNKEVNPVLSDSWILGRDLSKSALHNSAGSSENKIICTEGLLVRSSRLSIVPKSPASPPSERLECGDNTAGPLEVLANGVAASIGLYMYFFLALMM